MAKRRKKPKVDVNWLVENWKLISILFFLIGQLITVVVWKTNLERDIQDRITTTDAKALVQKATDLANDKITQEQARTLIQLENGDLKQDVHDIKVFLINKGK